MMCFNPRLKPRVKPRAAFTLVELLVVVAIIGLLISILLPALEKARVIARNVVCQSNLRQVGIGTSYYLSENLQYFPHREDNLGRHQMRYGYDVNGSNNPRASWQVDDEETTYGLPATFHKLDYIRGNGVYICPSQGPRRGEGSYLPFDMREWGNTYSVNLIFASKKLDEVQGNFDPQSRGTLYWASDNWLKAPAQPNVINTTGLGSLPSALRYELPPHRIGEPEISYNYGNTHSLFSVSGNDLFDIGGVNAVYTDGSTEAWRDQLAGN